MVDNTDIEMTLLAKDMGKFDPIYSFVGDDGEQLHISVKHLRGWVLVNKPEVVFVPVNRRLGIKFIQDGVVSLKRINELMRRTLDPIIFCVYGYDRDGNPNVYMADGHHRYCIAGMRNQELVPSHMLTQEIWGKFVVTGFPKLSQDQLRKIPLAPRNY